MATLDRGFKTWAERTALALRAELGLAPRDPFDPLVLAQFLDVDVCTPNTMQDLPEASRHQLLEGDPWGWSAVSLVLPTGRGLLIYNPRRSKGRRASDITHELAHLLLDHKPATLILSTDGSLAMRTFEEKQEEEANWLAWCLLLPRDALLKARSNGLTVPQIADRYQVTEPLVTFRLNMSGVDFQLRTKRKHRSS
jgi:hypothetical protein